MAPKERPISELGAPEKHRNGWRVRVKISGRKTNGPQRETKSEAEADLDRARQSASRNEMEKCLQEMREPAPQAREVKQEEEKKRMLQLVLQMRGQWKVRLCELLTLPMRSRKESLEHW